MDLQNSLGTPEGGGQKVGELSKGKQGVPMGSRREEKSRSWEQETVGKKVNKSRTRRFTCKAGTITTAPNGESDCYAPHQIPIFLKTRFGRCKAGMKNISKKNSSMILLKAIFGSRNRL